VTLANVLHSYTVKVQQTSRLKLQLLSADWFRRLASYSIQAHVNDESHSAVQLRSLRYSIQAHEKDETRTAAAAAAAVACIV
jgi:hypothetical protein